MVVGQIGAGRTIEDVLADYPYLERMNLLVDMNLSPLNEGALVDVDPPRTRVRLLPPK